MKRYNKYVLTALFILSCALSFTACGGDGNTPITTTLNAPQNVRIENFVLLWDTVDNASGYLVSVNGVTNQVSGNTYSLSTLTIPKTYELKVQAKGNGTTFTDSDWSIIKKYIVEGTGTQTQKLSAPTNLQISDTMLTWNAVSNTSGYSVQIDSDTPVFNGTSTSYSLASLTTAGTYSLKVRAVGDGTNFTDSDWSIIKEYTVEESIDNNGHSLLTVDGFTQDGNSWLITVPNATTELSFTGRVIISPNATWQVSMDISGINIVSTRTISLNEGNNTVYILVIAQNGNDMSLYSMVVRRRPMYTVTYLNADNTTLTTQKVEEGNLTTAPEASFTGYDFNDWNFNFNNPITDNTTITAQWTAVVYTITYENLLNGSNPNSSITTYTIESPTIYFDTPIRTGYIGMWNKTSIPSGSTGNQIITANWTANKYIVTVQKNIDAAGTVNAGGAHDFESPVTITATTTNTAYTWIGWYVNGTLISADQ